VTYKELRILKLFEDYTSKADSCVIGSDPLLDLPSRIYERSILVMFTSLLPRRLRIPPLLLSLASPE